MCGGVNSSSRLDGKPPASTTPTSLAPAQPHVRLHVNVQVPPTCVQGQDLGLGRIAAVLKVIAESLEAMAKLEWGAARVQVLAASLHALRGRVDEMPPQTSVRGGVRRKRF